ncbi:conjugative relaxase domain-containing protein, TrwC/TraI family [Marinomonas polaris DSM 16579]|uniref:Conjugative relaxase domain-containing protein, TrwC/TraI family n=1 Tax=Marinomonas polaris DSM 16579 TaxID=1122206 RepID=A0A1M5EZH7_9GAMM|nr:MobF family relaxase [Marinomonas polaris]SHF84412.1 conjugative relaxase domain-containing protein, TrwC/TraI family [Marinomonas polaris DSM 16579]
MMTIKLISASSKQGESYLDYLEEDNYYASETENGGVLAGSGALLLKKKQLLGKESFERIFKPLLGKKNQRIGWDVTFSDPKSVSVLTARADLELRNKIHDAREKSVKEAIEFLEKHAGYTRRGHNGYEQEAVTGFIAVLYEHSTSRDQDPQFHTHCLIKNGAFRFDGSFGTLESNHLYKWQKATGAVYRAALARRMQDLGFSIERTECKPEFEIEGIPRSVCEHFSKRKKVIREKLFSVGVRTTASKIGSKIVMMTRKKKQNITDRPALFQRWQNEMDELNFRDEHVRLIQKKSVEISSEPMPLNSIVKLLTEKISVFRLQDLYAAIAVEAQFYHAEIKEIESAVQYLLAEQSIIELGIDNKRNRLYTTTEILSLEKELLEYAQKLQSKNYYQLSESKIVSALEVQCVQQGYSLSDEQIEAVHGVCQSNLDILQGAAGAGKSSSMSSMKLAYETAGFRVIGATISRQASLQLENETGIQSGTLAKLLVDIETKKISLSNTVLVIDEAGLVSTHDLVTLFKAVDNANGKLVLVGEQQQLSAITHDGSLRFLSQQRGCTRIETIRRQRELWARQAVMDLREGNSLKALLVHQERGLLHFSDSSEKSREKLIDKWLGYKNENPSKQSLILAYRWSDVKLLNKDVRKSYQEMGVVGLENLEADCIIGKHEMTLSFSTGDRVRFSKNDYSRNLTNGEIGTIVNIKKFSDDIRFTVELDSNREVSFYQSEYSDEDSRLFLVHAYASTIYSSQGRTIDGDTFVYYTSGVDRSASYVAGSRHKDQCHWFINREELDWLSGSLEQDEYSNDSIRLATLAEQMSKNNKPIMAIEFLEEIKLETAKTLKSAFKEVPDLSLFIHERGL